MIDAHTWMRTADARRLRATAASGSRIRTMLARAGAQRVERRQYLVILFTALFGIAVTLGIVSMVRSSERRVAIVELESIARDRVSIIENDFNVAEMVLQTLRSLMESAEHPVSRDEFINFSRSLHIFAAGLRDTVWAPRVTLAERPAFEQSMRDSGFPDFEIREPGPDGKLVRAGARDAYFPIVYAEGDPRANKIIGVNLGFDDNRRAALRHTEETGMPAATPPLHLLTVPPDHFGLLSFLMVKRRNPLVDSTPLGVVLSAFDASVMIESIIAKKASLPGLDVFVFGPAAKPNTQPIYALDSTKGAPPVNLQTLTSGPHLSSQFMISDQPWLIIFRPNSAAVDRLWTWSTLTPLITGLSVSFCVVAYLLVSARRTAKLEEVSRNLRRTGEELSTNMAQVRYLAHHDQLTGLPNRLVFYDRLRSAIGGVSTQRPFFLLYLDLDRFKPVNDTFGHAAGDQVLCEVATRMRTFLREGDLLARLGGDEFAIITHDTETFAGAHTLAQRLIEAASEPYAIGDDAVCIGMSIGIASAPKDGETAESLQTHADHALYAAKNAGRGTVRRFTATAAA